MALRVRGWAAPGSVRGAFPQALFCLNPQVGVQSSYRSVRPAWFNTDYAAAARRMNPIRQTHLRLVSEGEREGEMNIGHDRLFSYWPHIVCRYEAEGEIVYSRAHGDSGTARDCWASEPERHKRRTQDNACN